MNLYLTTSQYLFQSSPYFLPHLRIVSIGHTSPENECHTVQSRDYSGEPRQPRKRLGRNTEWAKRARQSVPMRETGTSPQCSSGDDDIQPRWVEGMMEGTCDFSRICPPPTRQQAVSVLRLDEGRVFDDAPRELRESIAESRDALHLHPESTLLGHGRVEAERAYISGTRLRRGHDLHVV